MTDGTRFVGHDDPGMPPYGVDCLMGGGPRSSHPTTHKFPVYMAGISELSGEIVGCDAYITPVHLSRFNGKKMRYYAPITTI